MIRKKSSHFEISKKQENWRLVNFQDPKKHIKKLRLVEIVLTQETSYNISWFRF